MPKEKGPISLFVFLGPPGSGKGTQAKRLASAYRMSHLSTGDVFRGAIQKNTALGRDVKEYLDSGRLVPDDLVSKTVFEKLKDESLEGRVILDGYPRTLDQARALEELEKRDDFSVRSVVFFEVDSEELVRRLSARRQCPVCKEVYNLISRPPAQSGRCDKSHADLVQREDDKPEVVRERLSVYEKETQPLLEFYRGKGILVAVDAAKNIDQVFQELSAVLRSREAPAS